MQSFILKYENYRTYKHHNMSMLYNHKLYYTVYLSMSIILSIIYNKIYEFYFAKKITDCNKDDISKITNIIIRFALLNFVHLVCHFILNIISNVLSNKCVAYEYYKFLHKLNKINLKDIKNMGNYNLNSIKSFYVNCNDNILCILDIMINIFDIIYNIYTLYNIFPKWIVGIYILTLFISYYIEQFTRTFLKKKNIQNVQPLKQESNRTHNNLMNNIESIYTYNSSKYFINSYIKKNNVFIKQSLLYKYLYEMHMIFLKIISFFASMFLCIMRPWKLNISKTSNDLIIDKIAMSNDISNINSCQKLIYNNMNDNINELCIINYVFYLYDNKKSFLCLDKPIENVSITNVNYTINDTKILQNININIEKGDRVLFYGPSGCGKTTLQKLIFGHLVPNDGEIRLNDIPINEIDANDVLLKTSILKQENTIFDDTIYENISMGNVSKEQVQNLCTKANLHVDIDRNAYDALSGGEARRVNTLRMIANYKQNNLIITDESAAGLNRFNMQNMFDLIKSNTSNESILICIEHHIEVIAIMNINKIIVFEPIENGGYTTITMTVNEFDEYIRKSIYNNAK